MIPDHFKFPFMALALTSLVACQKNTLDHVASLAADAQVISNIEYAHVDSTSLLLDIYVPAIKLGEPPWIEYAEVRKPTLLFLHGGGWTSGDKISRSLQVMPFVDKGWCVVTANYRHLDETTLAGITGDARLSLNWIYENAGKYKFDTTRIIVSGESAGGHLALMAGFIADDDKFRQGGKQIKRPLKVAGVINWFGVADLSAASGTWDRAYLKNVVKDTTRTNELLILNSPVTYITAASPPVMTIHGDLDTAAPYAQAGILHDKLNAAGVKNKFLTIPGKKHGNFDPGERTAIFKDIWKFLKEIGVEQ